MFNMKGIWAKEEKMFNMKGIWAKEEKKTGKMCSLVL